MWKLRLKFTAFILLFALVLTACSQDSGSKTEEHTGGDLIVATLSEASSLDPHIASDVPSGNVSTNIYETLTTFDEDMELKPLLAESWEAVEDNIWEFKLREGVKFHDGSEFNAEVVKTNIERILDEKIASPRVILFEIVQEVKVIDDYKVQFITAEPFAPLPAHMAHYASSMISKEVIEKDYEAMENGDDPGTYINNHPIGTGYFIFDTWDSGKQITLNRNEDYWGEPAKVDTVTIKIVPEDLTRVAELETGEAHIIEPITPSDMERVEQADGTNVYQRNAASITYLGFNMEKEPFNDQRVRQAVAKALSKDKMLEGILEGTGELATGPVNDTNFGYSDKVKGVEKDIEGAKALLKEAGYENGFKTTIWTNDSRERIDVATLAQSDLAEIGIDVEIKVVEWGAYLEATSAGEHDMFILGLSLGTGDADYPMHMLFHSEHAGTGNRVFMKDNQFDKMLYEARIEQDQEKRLEMYVDATDYLNEVVPMVFLYHPDHIMGYRDEVKGFWADSSGFYKLKDVTINE